MDASPSSQVWLNELIMTEIFTALLDIPNGKEELKRCLTLSHYGFHTVCKVLHKDLTDANLQRIREQGCGIVTPAAVDAYSHSGLIAKITAPLQSISQPEYPPYHGQNKTAALPGFEVVVHLDQRNSQGHIGLDVRYRGPASIRFDVLFAHKETRFPGLWLRSLYFEWIEWTNAPANELLPSTNDASALAFYHSLVELHVPGMILYPRHLAELRNLPSLRELSCWSIAADMDMKEASAALKNIERLKYTSNNHSCRIDKIVSNVTSLRHLELNHPDYPFIQTSMVEGWRSSRERVNKNLVTLTFGIAHRDCRAISPAFIGLYLSRYFSRGTLLTFKLKDEPTEEQQKELLTWTRHVREFYAYIQLGKLCATPHKGWIQMPLNVNGNIDGQLEGGPTIRTEDDPQTPHEQPE